MRAKPAHPSNPPPAPARVRVLGRDRVRVLRGIPRTVRVITLTVKGIPQTVEVIVVTVEMIIVTAMRGTRGTPVTVARPDPMTMIHPRVALGVRVVPGVLLPHPVPSVLPPVQRPGRVPLRPHRASRSGHPPPGGKTIREKAIGGKAIGVKVIGGKVKVIGGKAMVIGGKVIVIGGKVRSIRSSARLRPGPGTRAPHARPAAGPWVAGCWVGGCWVGGCGRWVGTGPASRPPAGTGTAPMSPRRRCGTW